MWLWLKRITIGVPVAFLFCLCVAQDVRSKDFLPIHGLMKAAETGDRDAQFRLALEYENGWRIAKDLSKAHDWYEQAAGAGNAQAASNLGHLYKYGKGVSKDYAEALKWYRKSADAGNPDGQNRLGVMYENGLGVERDAKKAVEFYRKAADQGFEKAQSNLGLLYLQGEGVEKSIKNAVFWLKKAANNGFHPAQKSLAKLFYQANKEEYLAIAYGWMALAAVDDQAEFQRLVAEAYRSGEKVAKDPEKAFALFLRAAEQGDEQSQIRVAAAYLTGQLWAPQLPPLGVFWAKAVSKSADNKNAAAASKLANLVSLETAEKATVESMLDGWKPRSSIEADWAARVMMQQLRLRKLALSERDAPAFSKDFRNALIARDFWRAQGMVLGQQSSINRALVPDVVRYPDSVTPVILLEAAVRTPDDQIEQKVRLILLGMLQLQIDLSRCEGEYLGSGYVAGLAGAYKDIILFLTSHPDYGLRALEGALQEDALNPHTSPPSVTCNYLYAAFAAFRNLESTGALGQPREVPRESWSELRRLARMKFRISWTKSLVNAAHTKK